MRGGSGGENELVPEKDVAVERGRTVSASSEPWLRFRSPEIFKSARFVEITYRASIYDDPVRPVMRFCTSSGDVDRILPGPAAGAGIWRGAVPPGVEAVLISPCARAGRFDFRIEEVRPLGLFDMLAPVWRSQPSKLLSIVAPAIAGLRAEAESVMNWAIGGEPLEHFPQWRAKRARPLEPEGLDAPRSDWDKGPRFLLLIDAAGAAAEAITRTLEALRGQIYERFEAVILTPPQERAAAASPLHDARSRIVSTDELSSALLAGADFVAHLRAGDELTPVALAAVAEEAARNGAAQIVYADEIIASDDGLKPGFKPDWSPRFEESRPYLGRCAFIRAALLRAASDPLGATAIRRAALCCDRSGVSHIRRWLMARPPEPAPAEGPAPAPRGAPPSASIIMLTKDRADLLRPCLDSVLNASTHPDFELVIVDNGTRQKEALALLEKAATDSRVKILRRPGPFDFAKLNNEAARASTGEVLLFLNNDTEAAAEDWLEQMSLLAIDARVGAVGAQLLYPDGQIQHAGVVVGLNQDAAHFEALAPPGAPTWLGRAAHIHEVSAVTAACMAVERRKFEAAGGFDEDNLPIEFNDVDLCLRLGERGWPACYLPNAQLFHKESATRGNALLRPFSVHAAERDYFRSRWRGVIRDDPYFHPALSLYSRRLALG